MAPPCKNWPPLAGGGQKFTGGGQKFSARFARHLAPPWPKLWNRPCILHNSILWCRLFQHRFCKSYLNVAANYCLPLNADYVIGIVELVSNKLKISQAGAVSEFWSGGCEIASEASRKFLAPPVNFWPPPAGGGQFLQGGANH